jgi:Predicted ATP-dependent serine protease
MAVGMDANRVSLLLAVLEKKSGGNFLANDVYVNLAGGLQVDEPALDLAVIAALLSSQRNLPIRHDLVVFGEVGLLGEVRSVSQPDLRAREAALLGFRRVIVPQANAAEIRADVEVIPVRRIDEFASALFS